MSESEMKSEQLFHDSNQNMEKENIITTSNYNSNNNIEKNDQLKSTEGVQKNEEKKGQYILTPLESLLINKLMPHGFKFETEENILKLLETTKNQSKRNKQSNKHYDNPYKTNNHNNKEKNKGHPQIKRRINQGMSNIDEPSNNANNELNKTIKKCKIGLQRIKETPYVNTFYQSNNPDIPTLSKIENKLNNKEYSSFFDFAMDVRRIWSYFFNLGEKGDNEIYEKTSKMSEKWEKIYSDLENSNDDSYNIANNIKKRRDYNEYKEQYVNKESIPPPMKKNNQQNNDNKPMTLEEKNMLGNLIRNLNKEQLRGIIKILADNNDVMKSKYFEFDIDKLSIKKLRELERYVKDCLSPNNSNKECNSTQNINNNNTNNKNVNMNQNQVNKNSGNNKTNNNQNQNQNSATKNSVKEGNKTQEIKQEPSSLKKNKSGKKSNNNRNESFSESESISSDSSLSN